MSTGRVAHGPALRRTPADERLPAMDALRAFLVAWIIAGHALLGYSSVGGWTWSHVTEVRFDQRVEWALVALIGSTGVFLVGTFFLLAGVFTAVSLTRRTPLRFLERRVLRLGLPYVVTVVLVWPAATWLVRTGADRPVSLDLLRRQVLGLHAGAEWFIAVLLVYSVAYLAWYVLAPGPHDGIPMRVRHLVLAMLAMGAAGFLVRLWLPAHSSGPGDLHLWEWPQTLGPFLLGVAYGRALVVQVPERIYRGCGWALVAVVTSTPLIAAAVGIDDVASAAPLFRGGWHWQSAAMAAETAVLVVSGSLWLIGFAQRHVDGTGSFATATARASYAAFLLQNLVLVALAVLLRDLPWPAEAKAPLVGAGALVVCFGIGHLLATRTVLRRIL